MPELRKFALENRVVQMYPVYPRGVVLGEHPICMVTGEERKRMLEDGSARVIKHGSAIRLLLNLEQFRGVSAQMGPHVTVRAALGSRFHKAIAQAYMMAGTHCPLVLKSGHGTQSRAQ